MSPRRPLPAPLGADAAGRPTRAGLETVVGEQVLGRLREACDEVDIAPEARVEASRDWWPLSAVWAVEGTAPALPAVVVRPRHVAEVSAVLAVAAEARVPVTPFAGGSGVCGGSVPLHGGISMDLTLLNGLAGVDDASLLVDVRAGTFGDDLECELRERHGLTLGHWPQSMALSTVGGWLACRGAGQYSTRYGKIEDMVVGLEVVLAGGTTVRTGGHAPRAAVGPDLTQLFVGSEGTLGIVTEARLRAHPAPLDEQRRAFAFGTFAAGLEACRRVMRRGATPAVLRLYDEVESSRHFGLAGGCALIVVDEGDPEITRASMAVAESECADAVALGPGPAAMWLEKRNDVPDLAALLHAGIVADTVEVSGSWRSLPGIYSGAIEALESLEGTVAASAHQSHAYPDGGCLYFTFAGRPAGAPGAGPERAEAESYYRSAFDAVMRATAAQGGAISHHHGIGVNRGRYLPDHLGGAFEILADLKQVLDPRGILNPGKLGLRSPFGGRWEGWTG